MRLITFFVTLITLSPSTDGLRVPAHRGGGALPDPGHRCGRRVHLPPLLGPLGPQKGTSGTRGGHSGLRRPLSDHHFADQLAQLHHRDRHTDAGHPGRVCW